MVGDSEWMRAWASASLHTNHVGGLPPSPKLMPFVEALRVLERGAKEDANGPGNQALETIKQRVHAYANIGKTSQWVHHGHEFEEMLDYFGWDQPTQADSFGVDERTDEPFGVDERTGQAWWEAQEQPGGSDPQGVLWRRTPTALYDAASLITTVTVGGIVRRPLADLETSLNPVNWASLSSESPFTASYQVELHEGRVVYERNGRPRRAMPQPIGGWEGVLVEEVDLSWLGVPINGFRNLLNISFRRPEPGPESEPGPEPKPKPSLELAFDLRQALTSSSGGIERPGGLELDSGGATVFCFNDAFVESWRLRDPKLHEAFERINQRCSTADCTDVWYVEISKTLRFATLTPRIVSASPLHSGQVMNYFASAVVTPWMDLAAALGVFKVSP